MMKVVDFIAPFFFFLPCYNVATGKFKITWTPHALFVLYGTWVRAEWIRARFSALSVCPQAVGAASVLTWQESLPAWSPAQNIVASICPG